MENLVNELAQGREVARQLQILLSMSSSSSSSSGDTREMLAQKIVASYENALSMLNLSSSIRSLSESYPQPTVGVAIGMSESPSSRSGSPRSEDSERDFKDQDLANKDAARKRKSTPRWTQQVRVSPGLGLERTLEDGFSWRKYGQKDILGAKYPRGYYRCTHRTVQGCLATKQVQRSNEDPTIFEITYCGRHTCTQVSHVPPPSQPPENQETNTLIMEPQQQIPHQNNQQQSQDLLLSFRSGLKVITEGLDSHEQQQSFPPFHFPSTSYLSAENQVFSPSMRNYSPSFISPSTCGTNYFVVASSNGINHNIGGNQNFQTSDQSERTNIYPATTSATNSPSIAGGNFPFGNVEFDPNFTFDNHGFHS